MVMNIEHDMHSYSFDRSAIYDRRIESNMKQYVDYGRLNSS